MKTRNVINHRKYITSAASSLIIHGARNIRPINVLYFNGLINYYWLVYFWFLGLLAIPLEKIDMNFNVIPDINGVMVNYCFPILTWLLSLLNSFCSVKNSFGTLKMLQTGVNCQKLLLTHICEVVDSHLIGSTRITIMLSNLLHIFQINNPSIQLFVISLVIFTHFLYEPFKAKLFFLLWNFHLHSYYLSLSIFLLNEKTILDLLMYCPDY